MKGSRVFLRCTAVFFLVAFTFCAARGFAAEPAKPEGPSFTEVKRFQAKEARQGIAVDAGHFYAIDNTTIGKYEKSTGNKVAEWKGSKEFPAIHFDGGVVVDGKLYLPHSNYPESPMTSSVEIFDAATVTPVGTHSFGILLGSLTWVDRHDGFWWAVFANYSRIFGTDKAAYGHTHWTSFVKLDDNWKVLEQWVFPLEVLKRSEPMSISGGSWGPDGLLYVSGHDHPEVYAMRLPKMGSVLELVKTLPVNIAGQGIAWDRSKPGTLYGIVRKTKEVVVSELK